MPVSGLRRPWQLTAKEFKETRKILRKAAREEYEKTSPVTKLLEYNDKIEAEYGLQQSNWPDFVKKRYGELNKKAEKAFAEPSNLLAPEWTGRHQDIVIDAHIRGEKISESVRKEYGISAPIEIKKPRIYFADKELKTTKFTDNIPEIVRLLGIIKNGTGIRGRVGKELILNAKQKLPSLFPNISVKSAEDIDFFFGDYFGKPIAELSQLKPQEIQTIIDRFIEDPYKIYRNKYFITADQYQKFIKGEIGAQLELNQLESPTGRRNLLKVVEFPKDKPDLPKPVDAIRKWFGKSKVVDVNNKPLVVYHGTKRDFKDFDSTYAGSATGADSASKGIFFTSDPEVAEIYTQLGVDEWKLNELEKLSEIKKLASKRLSDARYDKKITDAEFAKIQQKAVDAQKAYDIIYRKTPWASQFGGQNIRPVFLKIENPHIVDFKGESRTFADLTKEIDIAKKNDNDGVIVKNILDPVKTDIYIVFSPSQIRSKFDN
jgi:hypothetical protein